jgi:hypothetical protein
MLNNNHLCLKIGKKTKCLYIKSTSYLQNSRKVYILGVYTI